MYNHVPSRSIFKQNQQEQQRKIRNKTTYNTGSFCTCGAVRWGIWLFKCGIIIGHHLQEKGHDCQAFSSSLLYFPSWLNSLFTSVSLCRFAITSSAGECGLFAGPPSIESSRPFGSSLGLLAALGFTSLPRTPVMAGGEGGFALTGGSAGDDAENNYRCCSRDQLHSFEEWLTWANNRDGHALVLSIWCCTGCWRVFNKKLFRRADTAIKSKRRHEDDNTSYKHALKHVSKSRRTFFNVKWCI